MLMVNIGLIQCFTASTVIEMIPSFEESFLHVVNHQCLVYGCGKRLDSPLHPIKAGSIWQPKKDMEGEVK